MDNKDFPPEEMVKAVVEEELPEGVRLKQVSFTFDALAKGMSEGFMVLIELTESEEASRSGTLGLGYAIAERVRESWSRDDRYVRSFPARKETSEGGRGLETDSNLNRLIAWSRHLYWAESQRRQYYALNDKEDASTEGMNWHSFAFLAHWYSGLWVVVQGRRSLELEDQVIDELLDGWPDLRDALRQFHVAVSQFQPDLLCEKLIKLIREPKHPIWVTLLHDEFHKFLWEQIDRIPGSEEQHLEIRRSVAKMTGWSGSKVHEETEQLAQLIKKVEGQLTHSNDQSSQEAQELRDAIADARKKAQEGIEGYRQYRETLLRQLRSP